MEIPHISINIRKKSLGLAAFLLHTWLEYILLDKSGLIKMTDSCWPNFWDEKDVVNSAIYILGIFFHRTPYLTN